MQTDELDSSQDPPDLSWSKFFLVAMAMNAVAYIYDERLRPMRDVDPVEKFVWYLSYGAGFLVMPGLAVLLIHLISKRKGRGMSRPKRTAALWGFGFMIFTLAVTGVRLQAR
jgi:hypothetical protein